MDKKHVSHNYVIKLNDTYCYIVYRVYIVIPSILLNRFACLKCFIFLIKILILAVLND